MRLPGLLAFSIVLWAVIVTNVTTEVDKKKTDEQHPYQAPQHQQYDDNDNCDHECDKEHHEWVCSTNDMSYQNPCELAKAACYAPEEYITTNHTGRCEKDAYDCPKGLFSTEDSDRCFKIFLDEELSWRHSNGKCLFEGLVIPVQIDRIAINLRKHILDHYGDSPVWLNARGNGYRLIWQKNKAELSNDSPLWLREQTGYYPGTRVTTNHCLTLAGKRHWKRQPIKPYASHECHTPQYTLCEYVCPEGFFRMKSSYQCFRMFKRENMNWTQAQENCHNWGLQLATNTNDIAVPLRKYILDHFGDSSSVWLSARGDSSGSGHYIWLHDQHDQQQQQQQQQQQEQDVLRRDNALWMAGQPGSDELTHDHCLFLSVSQYGWVEEPERPYATQRCSLDWAYPLCEVIGSRSGAPKYTPPGY